MFTPFQFPAGVVSTPTKTSRSGNWMDANLMRWQEKKLTPVGGWAKRAYGAPASRIRAVHTWVTLAGDQMTAYLCEGHCYVDKGDGVLTSISPTVPIAPPSSVTGAGGYGDNLFSFGDYGTPRPTRTDIKNVTPGYYVDNWGQNLVVMTGTDGRLLMWDPSAPATPLTAVAGAPVSNRAFIVTPQRHVMLFGAGGIPNRFAFCSQEDITDWNYASVTNTAGFYDIEPSSPIIAASKAGDEIIFFTSAGDAFVSAYIGLPYIYNYERVAQGVSPISPMSIDDTPVGCVWVTFNGLWKYEARSVSPVQCNVWTWITDNCDTDHARFQASVVLVNTFSEIWWFFPEKNSAINTRYVMWNYKEGWWSVGRLKRTCGASSTYTTFPLMSDGTSVFQHEDGYFYNTDDGEETLPWVKSFSLNVQGGAVLSTFWQIAADIEGQYDAILFSLEYNIPRAGAGRPTADGQTSVAMNSGDKRVDEDGLVGFRDTGRDFRLIVKQGLNGIGPWSLGEQQFDIRPRGNK